MSKDTNIDYRIKRYAKHKLIIDIYYKMGKTDTLIHERTKGAETFNIVTNPTWELDNEYKLFIEDLSSPTRAVGSVGDSPYEFARPFREDLWEPSLHEWCWIGGELCLFKKVEFSSEEVAFYTGLKTNNGEEIFSSKCEKFVGRLPKHIIDRLEDINYE